MDEPTYHLTGLLHTKEQFAEDFEGPLDVILQLLSKNKIDISDISISEILNQYLAYLDEQKKMDMEIASEFIEMASYLMLIKTKMLLSYSEQQEALSEMQLLIETLTRRKCDETMAEIRKAESFLDERNGPYFARLPKQPESFEVDKTYRYSHSSGDLISALALLNERKILRMPPSTKSFQKVAGKEPFPIARKAEELIQRLRTSGISRLKALFQGSKSRSELIAAFLAVLELCRVNSLKLEESSSGDPKVALLSVPEHFDF